MKRILVFGVTGAGKTSMCSELVDRTETRPTGDGVKGVTFETYIFKPYAVKNWNGECLEMIDTVGLGEGDRGEVPAGKALIKLIDLLKYSDSGYSLVIQVVKKGRFTHIEEDNHDFFIKIICQNKVPAILVVTHCQSYDPMSVWVDENRQAIEDAGYQFKDIFCTCFGRGGRFEEHLGDLRKESQDIVLAAINKYSLEKPKMLYDKNSWREYVVGIVNKFLRWLDVDTRIVGSILSYLHKLKHKLRLSDSQVDEIAKKMGG